jgi:hypothetical protein
VSSPTSDVVSDQYSRWIYPQPILDIEVWCERNWQWFDPSHAYRLFWQNQKYRSNLDILVAGCGTNQAAVIAFNNPEDTLIAVATCHSDRCLASGNSARCAAMLFRKLAVIISLTLIPIWFL